MPKAKAKTKGAPQANEYKGLLLNNHDSVYTLPTPVNAVGSLCSTAKDAITDSAIRLFTPIAPETSKKVKAKHKKRIDGICKSKQLKEKKTSRSKTANVSTAGKYKHSSAGAAASSFELRFDSDDEKPLSSISHYKIPFSPAESRLYTPRSLTVLATDVVEANDRAYQETPRSTPLSIFPRKRKVVDCKKENETSSDDNTEPYDITPQPEDNDHKTQEYFIEEETKYGCSASKKIKMSPKNEEKRTVTDNNATGIQHSHAENMDSDKTEPYDYAECAVSPTYTVVSPTSTVGSNGRSFSPIPSTSKDNDAFKKNELRFQESLRVDDDVEIIDVPCETIIVDDGSPERVVSETIDISIDAPLDDDIELVSYSAAPKKSTPPPKIDRPSKFIDEILFRGFGSMDNVDNSDCEIVDVENVIAQNNAILQKYKNPKLLSSNTTEPTVVTPLDLSVMPERLESPPQFMDIDRISPFDPHERLRQDFSVTPPNLIAPMANPVEANQVMNDIVDSYFQNNPIPTVSTAPTVSKSNPLSCMCSTLNNILDHMSNILGDTPFEEANAANARVTSKQQVNNYANSLAVVDTVDLDADLGYWMCPRTAALAHPPQVLSILDTPVPVTLPSSSTPIQLNNHTTVQINDTNPRNVPMCHSVNIQLNTQNNGPILLNNTPIQINNTPIQINNTPIQINNTPIQINNTPLPFSFLTQNPQTSQKQATNKPPSPEKTSDSNKNKNDKRLLECPICMEGLGTRPLASTICGHIFCMQCIQKATSAPGGKKCPTCRKTFTKKGQSFHPLFL